MSNQTVAFLFYVYIVCMIVSGALALAYVVVLLIRKLRKK